MEFPRTQKFSKPGPYFFCQVSPVRSTSRQASVTFPTKTHPAINQESIEKNVKAKRFDQVISHSGWKLVGILYMMKYSVLSFSSYRDLTYAA
jgi:hypothetical protein